MRVPCWRTRMLPERTRSPPNFFTPRRWELLSRPLRLEPPPFLWAMSLSFDLFDFEPGEFLSLAGLFALTFFGFVVEDRQLGAFDLLDLGLDLDPLEEGGADGDVVAIGQEQHLFEGVCRSIFQGEAVYFNGAAFFAAVLFAAAL